MPAARKATSRAQPRAGDSETLRAFSRSLPMTLLRAREAVMDEFRPHLRELDITEQQWRVLRALETLGECNASTLAGETCISMPSLSRILAGLEQRELIERETDTQDLRATRIRARTDGLALIERGAPRSEAIYAGISKRFGKQRMDKLYLLLDELVDCLDEGTGEK